MKNKGFTLIELLIVVCIILILLSTVAGALLNNRGATESRAINGAESFLEANGIVYSRLTCAGDSDGDGYGSCAVRSEDGEKIMLNCPTGFIDVNLFGATGCKEVFNNINFGANG